MAGASPAASGYSVYGHGTGCHDYQNAQEREGKLPGAEPPRFSHRRLRSDEGQRLPAAALGAMALQSERRANK